MKIAIITASYPPMRNSGAIQVQDLAMALACAGHKPFVLFPDNVVKESVVLEEQNNITNLRIKFPKTRDRNYLIRAAFELIMPYAMWYRLSFSKFRDNSYDAVVCYSPSIFFAPLIGKLKSENNAICYLIVRDLFPKWSVDLGLIKSGSLIHKFFQFIEFKLYRAVDIIGVQTESNFKHFERISISKNTSVEVLYNWLSKSSNSACSINLNETKLRGRKIFVYAGNMGVAQGLESIISVINELKNDEEIGFLFVGRGTFFSKIKKQIDEGDLDNTIIYPEISPEEIPPLYQQCYAGLICLDKRHTTDNIPGKFLSYMRSSLPVLAVVNPENDIIKLIEENRVGVATDKHDIKELARCFGRLINFIDNDSEINQRCRALFEEKFSSNNAASAIIDALEKRRSHLNLEK